MKDVLLVGGGKIGAMITELLADCGDYRVTVADHDAAALREGGGARRASIPSGST